MVGTGNHPQVSCFQVGELECHSSISIKSLDPCAGHLHLFYSALFLSQAPWAPHVAQRGQVLHGPWQRCGRGRRDLAELKDLLVIDLPYVGVCTDTY